LGRRAMPTGAATLAVAACREHQPRVSEALVRDEVGWGRVRRRVNQCGFADACGFYYKSAPFSPAVFIYFTDAPALKFLAALEAPRRGLQVVAKRWRKSL
jgi:hypothetical protein